MKNISNLIKDVLHQLESQNTLQMQHVREVWEEVVPDETREQTSVLSYRSGTLRIGVRSQPLLSELENFRRNQIENRLREKGLSSLEDVKFEAH